MIPLREPEREPERDPLREPEREYEPYKYWDPFVEREEDSLDA